MVQESEEHGGWRHGVIFACGRADGRWLMVRRARSVRRAPGKVAFPGGEVHAGESQEAAVVREAWEELGLSVRPLRCVWEYDWPDRPWVLFGWCVEWIGDQQIRPASDEIAEVLWLTPEEGMAHPDAMPTNRYFFEALRAG